MAKSPDRSYSEFVGAVANVLDSLNVEYAFAGSFASSMYGEPRSTLDVDLTLHLKPDDADRFADAFDAVEMFADAETIREAFSYRNPIPFGVIDMAGAWKADCYLLRNDPYARLALNRRRELPYAEARRGMVWLYAPEDVILFKLEYYKISQGVSTKHLRDIAGMLTNMAARGESLDMAHLKRWASHLQVAEYWDKIWNDFQSRKE